MFIVLQKKIISTYITVSAAVVVGFFTFGIGTVVVL